MACRWYGFAVGVETACFLLRGYQEKLCDGDDFSVNAYCILSLRPLHLERSGREVETLLTMDFSDGHRFLGGSLLSSSKRWLWSGFSNNTVPSAALRLRRGR